MTRQGSWPNNLFLTPDLKPFSRSVALPASAPLFAVHVIASPGKWALFAFLIGAGYVIFELSDGFIYVGIFAAPSVGGGLFQVGGTNQQGKIEFQAMVGFVFAGR